MKISVLVTFYNQKNYVDRALGSIFSQKTTTDFEVLVGDDGSTDGTLDQIHLWKIRYPDQIKLFVMDRDTSTTYDPASRASLNRANLVTNAMGDYFTFLDGDDFYTDLTKLQTLFDILETPEQSTCIGCCHDMNFYYEDTGMIKPMKYGISVEGRISLQQYWPKHYISYSAFLFRNIFKGSFPDNFDPKYFNDNLITFYMLSHGPFFYIRRTMSNYTQLKESTWNRKSELEQHLVNFVGYEQEIALLPQFKCICLIRHFNNYKYLFKHKKNIPDDLFNRYYSIFLADGYTISAKLLHYSQSSLLDKIKIQYQFYYLKLNRQFYKKSLRKNNAQH